MDTFALGLPAVISVKKATKVALVSRYYRELHDRELLIQAELILREASQRKLIDVFLPEEAAPDDVFPRRVASATVKNGRLAIKIEGHFFQTTAR